MKIQVNAVHFNADVSLITFVQKKLNKLETFYDRIVSSEVFLKLDKGEKSKVQKKFVEVKVNVPGNTLFVRESGDSFEEATDIALDTLTQKIKRFKGKLNIVSREKPEPVPLTTDEIDD